MDFKNYTKYSFTEGKYPYVFFGNRNASVLTAQDKYYDPEAGYDKTLKDYYVSKGAYTQASEYLSMFMFTNPEQQAKRNLEILELKKKGEIEDAILKRATNENQTYATAFIRAADSGDFSNPELLNNPYYKRFRKIKETNFHYSDKVRAGFFNHVHDGMGGFFDFITGNWDAIPEEHSKLIRGLGFDNDEDAYSKLGVKTERNSKGEIECSIDVNNDNFIKFCNALSTNCGVGIIGGNGYNLWADGDDHEGVRAALGEGIEQIADLYNEAKGVRTELENAATNRVSSSTVYGYLVPQIGDLYQELLAGNLDEGRLSEIKESIKTLQDVYTTKLLGENLDRYDWYTDLYNDGSDTIERKVTSNKHKSDIRNRIMHAVGNGDAILQIKEAGGEFGTLVTLLPQTNSKGDVLVEGGTVWIKGLFADECKEKIGSDTKWQAMRDVADMERYGITHKLLDGRAIKVDTFIDGNGVTRPVLKMLDEDGNYIKDANGEDLVLQRHEAVQLMEIEKSVDQAYTHILYNNVNKEGNVINKQAIEDGIAAVYDQYGRITNKPQSGAKQFATYIANNIFTDSEDVTMDDIFGTHNILDMDYKKGVKVSEAQLIYYAILNKFRYLDDIGGEEE